MSFCKYANDPIRLGVHTIKVKCLYIVDNKSFLIASTLMNYMRIYHFGRLCYSSFLKVIVLYSLNLKRISSVKNLKNYIL